MVPESFAEREKEPEEKEPEAKKKNRNKLVPCLIVSLKLLSILFLLALVGTGLLQYYLTPSKVELNKFYQKRFNNNFNFKDGVNKCTCNSDQYWDGEVCVIKKV